MGKSLDEMTDEERSGLFPIILSEHNPDWNENYQKEKTVLNQAIGVCNIVRINHYGSTAIPNLIAKPTVDILLEIKDKQQEARMKILKTKYIFYVNN